MARQRFIHPEFWTDPNIGQMTPVERLFFIGCFSNADDEGRLLGNPAYLRSIIFPYDDMSIDDVRTMRDRVIATCKNLVLYEVDSVEYLAFRKWREYQKPKYPTPSKLPLPPEEGNPPEGQPDDESRPGDPPGEAFPQGSGNASPTLGKDLPPGLGLGLGMGRERVGLGEGVGEPAQQPPSDITPTERALLRELKAVAGYPFDYGKDLDYIRSLLVDFADLDLMDEAKKWSTYKRDKPLGKNSNPRLQLRNWLAKAREFARERRAKDGRNRGSREPPPGKGKYDDLVIRDSDLPLP
ncbi:MAG: hypothetical protein ACM309_09655 [Bacillota bacterium]